MCWVDRPALADVAAVVHEVMDVKTACNQRVLYLGIIKPEVALPTSEVRQAFIKRFGIMAGACESMDIVIDGNDLRSTLLRTLVRSMALVFPERKMRVCDQLDQVTTRWQEAYGMEAAVLLANARRLESAATTESAVPPP